METFTRRICSVFIICILIALTGCSSAPVVPPTPNVSSGSGVDFSSKDSVTNLFEGRKLDPIEGMWAWSDNTYEVAIYKNTTGIEMDYEYVGVIIRGSIGRWGPGMIKLLLNSTSVDSVFVGVYFMGDQSRLNTTYILDGNLLKTSLPLQGGETLILRTYPKRGKNGNADKQGDAPSVSQGTGFFISNDGYLITNHHVVENAKSVAVLLPDGREMNASVVRSSSATDLALLKCDSDIENYLSIGETIGVGIGEEVYTIGYPSVAYLGSGAKLTDGVVSSMTGLQNDNSFMQVTVPIQPGNSGGPLVLRETGEVIGIITSTAAVESFYKETGSLPQNINWAVKADYVRLLIQGLVDPQKDGSSRKTSEVAKAVVILKSTK